MAQTAVVQTKRILDFTELTLADLRDGISGPIENSELEAITLQRICTEFTNDEIAVGILAPFIKRKNKEFNSANQRALCDRSQGELFPSNLMNLPINAGNGLTAKYGDFTWDMLMERNKRVNDNASRANAAAEIDNERVDEARRRGLKGNMRLRDVV